MKNEKRIRSHKHTHDLPTVREMTHNMNQEKKIRLTEF